jgi:tetratricopeptide (TPR) repeat protein
MDRVEQLRRFVEASPGDPFPRYALALELKGRGDQQGAAVELQGLLKLAPGYLAAYLQLGMLLQALGRPGEARGAFQSGQEIARRQGNGHALSELTSALDALG